MRHSSSSMLAISAIVGGGLGAIAGIDLAASASDVSLLASIFAAGGLAALVRRGDVSVRQVQTLMVAGTASWLALFSFAAFHVPRLSLWSLAVAFVASWCVPFRNEAGDAEARWPRTVTTLVPVFATAYIVMRGFSLFVRLPF